MNRTHPSQNSFLNSIHKAHIYTILFPMCPMAFDKAQGLLFYALEVIVINMSLVKSIWESCREIKYGSGNEQLSLHVNRAKNYAL